MRGRQRRRRLTSFFLRLPLSNERSCNMIIRYTGRKPSYTLKLTKKKIYLFNPTCEITDEKTINFLLNPKLKGLFINEDMKGKPEKQEVIETPVKEEKPVYKCGVCGYEAKTKQALSAHMRKHK